MISYVWTAENRNAEKFDTMNDARQYAHSLAMCGETVYIGGNASTLPRWIERPVKHLGAGIWTTEIVPYE